MANGQENLIPFNERSEEEHRKIASKGGIKSGETRRQKRAIKDIANTILGLPNTNPNNIKQIEELGIDKEDIDNQTVMVVALMSKAFKGDTKAFNSLMSITGDAIQTVNVNTVTDEKVKELEAILNEE